MVGLDRALGHQGIGVLFKGVAQQKLQLARLVAPARETGAVVALDPEIDAQRLRQPGQGLQRRGQMGETNARKAGEMHGKGLLSRPSPAACVSHRKRAPGPCKVKEKPAGVTPGRSMVRAFAPDQ